MSYAELARLAAEIAENVGEAGVRTARLGGEAGAAVTAGRRVDISAQAQEGVRSYVQGRGIPSVRAAVAGTTDVTTGASYEAGQAIRNIVGAAEPRQQRLYRGLSGAGTGSHRMAGVQRPDYMKMQVGEEFDLPLSSFTEDPTSPSVRDFFTPSSKKPVVELRGGRTARVEDMIPGEGVQKEHLTYGRMQVVEKSPGRVVIEPTSNIQARGQQMQLFDPGPRTPPPQPLRGFEEASRPRPVAPAAKTDPNPIYRDVPEEVTRAIEGGSMTGYSMEPGVQWVHPPNIRSGQQGISRQAVAQMSAGDLPNDPINVMRYEGTDYIWDANHRVNAALRQGRMFMPARVAKPLEGTLSGKTVGKAEAAMDKGAKKATSDANRARQHVRNEMDFVNNMEKTKNIHGLYNDVW